MKNVFFMYTKNSTNFKKFKLLKNFSKTMSRHNYEI